MATPEDIERKLTCSICLHLLEEPKLLTCGHTYCLSCLHSHICHADTPQTVGQVLGFTCPLCREFVPAPDSTSPPLAWAGQYRTNYIVQDLLDLHRDNRKRKPPCSQHAGKVLELFCRDCNAPVCDRCVSLQHRACAEVVELLTVVKEKQNVTGQQLLWVNAMISQCDGKRQRCDAGRAALDQIEFDVGQNIERECREILQKVAAHLFRESERLKQDARIQCDSGKALVRSYVAKCQELKTVLERMRTYLLRKTTEVTISSPPNIEDERRVANTLTKLSQAVSAIDNPCHFEVGLYLDDTALTRALADLRLGEVSILQVSDVVQHMNPDAVQPRKSLQVKTDVSHASRSNSFVSSLSGEFEAQSSFGNSQGHRECPHQDTPAPDNVPCIDNTKTKTEVLTVCGEAPYDISPAPSPPLHRCRRRMGTYLSSCEPECSAQIPLTEPTMSGSEDATTSSEENIQSVDENSSSERQEVDSEVNHVIHHPLESDSTDSEPETDEEILRE